MKQEKNIIQALNFDDMQQQINIISSLQETNKIKIYFIYENNGWRFRILVLIDEKIHSIFYGELFEGEYKSKAKKSPIITQLNRLITKHHINIFSLDYNPPTGIWPLADEIFSLKNININLATELTKQNINLLEDFAKNRKILLKKHKDTRPKLIEHGREYIITRSLGCCEFDNCAKPLFRNERGEYGNFGTLAHIIAASQNGPRAQGVISQDEIRDPKNFLYLCEDHHRLIDKIDVESFSITRLRKMAENSENLSRLLSTQLKYTKSTTIALIGDILGITTEISDREVLNALLDVATIPNNGEIKRPIKLIDTSAEKSSYSIYWAQFLDSKKLDLDTYKHILRDNNKNTISIFALGSMPFLFLMGYMTGESRLIQLFHRSRQTHSWIWPKETTPRTKFKYEVIYANETQKKHEEAILILSITANLENSRIPSTLQDLPILKISGDCFHQDPFGSTKDFEDLQIVIQNALNEALDNLKVKKLHIITMAPAISIFALGQKIQQRNAPQIIMYQLDRDTTAYPVLTFDNGKVSSYDHPSSSYTFRS